MLPLSLLFFNAVVPQSSLAATTTTASSTSFYPPTTEDEGSMFGKPHENYWLALHSSHPDMTLYPYAAAPDCLDFDEPIVYTDRYGKQHPDSVICIHKSDPHHYQNWPTILHVEKDTYAVLVGCQKNAEWNLKRLKSRKPDYKLNYGYFELEDKADAVSVYVVDTFVDVEHPGFEGRARLGFASTQDNKQLHGTHVAGTIASSMYGVSKQSEIVEVRVLNDDGSSPYSNLLKGLSWISQDMRRYNIVKTAVINLSLAGKYSEIVNIAIDNLYRQGAVVVAAAGNDYKNACLYSPASAVNAITVGSTSASDSLSSFSNWGSCVDIYAPGESILSLRSKSNHPVWMSGTSMAAPHVAGSAALYLQMYDNHFNSPKQVKKYIVDNISTKGIVKNLAPQSYNKLLYFGSGATECTGKADTDVVADDADAEDDDDASFATQNYSPMAEKDDDDADYAYLWKGKLFGRSREVMLALLENVHQRFRLQ